MMEERDRERKKLVSISFKIYNFFLEIFGRIIYILFITLNFMNNNKKPLSLCTTADKEAWLGVDIIYENLWTPTVEEPNLQNTIIQLTYILPKLKVSVVF